MGFREHFTTSAVIRFTYDPKANAAFLYLADINPGDVAGHGIVDKRLGPILTYNAQDQIIGVEILFARENLTPALLNAAERAGGVLELHPPDS
jgi:uncharacterized protein YuzE